MIFLRIINVHFSTVFLPLNNKMSFTKVLFDCVLQFAETNLNVHIDQKISTCVAYWPTFSNIKQLGCSRTGGGNRKISHILNTALVRHLLRHCNGLMKQMGDGREWFKCRHGIKLRRVTVLEILIESNESNLLNPSLNRSVTFSPGIAFALTSIHLQSCAAGSGRQKMQAHSLVSLVKLYAVSLQLVTLYFFVNKKFDES